MVVLRGVGFGRLWWAMPARVVQDTLELIALYWRAGTRWKDVGRHPLGGEFLMVRRVELRDLIWSRTDVLLLKKPNDAHSIWLMWLAGEKKLDCWYVNLETPFKRTPLGFDVMDHELDIVISPDRSDWHWKDEAAFAEMVAAGVFSSPEAFAIRSEGERVLRQLNANCSPFCDGWENWRPPAEWTVPTLPHGWDEL